MLVWSDEYSKYQDAQKLLSNATRVLEFEASELRELLVAQKPETAIADLLGIRSVCEALKPSISTIACEACGREISPWSEAEFRVLEDFGPGSATQFLIVVELSSATLSTELGALGYLDLIGVRAVIVEQKLVRRADFDQEQLSTSPTLLAVLSVSARADFNLAKLSASYPVLAAEMGLQLWAYSRTQDRLSFICEINSDYFCQHCQKSSQARSVVKFNSSEFLYWEDFWRQPIDQILKQQPDAFANKLVDTSYNWQQLSVILGVLSDYQLGALNLFSSYQELTSIERFALFLAVITLKRVPDVTLVLHNLDRLISDLGAVQNLLQEFQDFGARVVLLSNSSKENRCNHFLNKLLKIKVLKSDPLNSREEAERELSTDLALIQVRVVPLIKSELSLESSSLISYLGIWTAYREMLKSCVLPGNPQLDLKQFDGLRQSIHLEAEDVLPIFSWRGISPATFVQLGANDFMRRADFLRPEPFLRAMRILTALNIGECSLFQPIFDFSSEVQRRLLLAKAIFDANVHGARENSSCLVFDQSLIDWPDSELFLFEALLDVLVSFQAEVIVLDSSDRFLGES
jgi:hypothetical protein